MAEGQVDGFVGLSNNVFIRLRGGRDNCKRCFLSLPDQNGDIPCEPDPEFMVRAVNVLHWDHELVKKARQSDDDLPCGIIGKIEESGHGDKIPVDAIATMARRMTKLW